MFRLFLDYGGGIQFQLKHLVANKDITEVSVIMWKAKQIDRVCHSSNDAETLAMSEMLDNLVYLARQIEISFYRDYKPRMQVRIYTDSEPTLESIVPTKKIERKGLRMTVQELKERLIE